MAEGHSNAAIARPLVLSEAAVGKHVGNILAKFSLPPTVDTNRRVLTVLTYLRDRWPNYAERACSRLPRRPVTTVGFVSGWLFAIAESDTMRPCSTLPRHPDEL